MATENKTVPVPDNASPNTSSSDFEHQKDSQEHSTAIMAEKAPEENLREPAVEQPQKPTANTNSPPNGGLVAWLQVAGAFMIFFNSWGILNTFGVFQTYYESGTLFNETSTNISWIGSIQAYCVLLGGVFSGPIYDRGYLRILIVIGAFGVVFGHMMLSICHAYWQVLLAQGFCIGLGAGLMFVPSLAVLPAYFNTRIGLAMGLAACGSSFGGVIYPIVFYRLIDQIGFGWSVRVLGFIALITCLLPIVVLKQRVKPAKARALVDWSAFVDGPFIIFTLGAVIGFIGLYAFLFFQSYYALAQRITDAKLAFYLVPILNASSMFGRTIPNAISDKTGALNLIIPGAFMCGILGFCMLAVDSVGGIVVVVLLFGFFSGVFIALPPVLFVAFTKDKSRIGTRIGMGFAMLGFGCLAGGPGGGSILGNDAASLNWTGVWVYAGVTSVVSGLVFLGLRIWKVGPKLMVKV